MKNVARIVCSIGLLGLLAWRTDWAHIAESFAQIRLGYWLGAVAAYLATQMASSLRWQILSRPLGFARPFWQYASFYFIGMFFNLVLPTSVGGDVVRAWYLDGGAGQKSRAFLSVFVDRLSGLLVMLTLAAGATLLMPIALPAWVIAGVWASVAAAVLGLALLPRLSRHPLLQARLGALGAEASQCVIMTLRPSAIFLSLFVQAGNIVLVWMVGQAIGAAVPFGYYWVVVPMVSLLTMAPLSINGLGVREGGMVLFLAPLGVPSGTAVTLAFLWFCAFSTASLLGGLVYLFGQFPRPEVQTNHEAVRHHSDQGRARQPKAAA
jgi:uncharacterized membrane protein YbhN (UPF0104 family)